MKTTLLLIAGAVITVLVLWIFAEASTFTAYPVRCDDWVEESKLLTTPIKPFSSCLKPIALNRQTFTVDKEKNQVIMSSSDAPAVSDLGSCVVQDAFHWSCENNSGSSPIFKTTLSGGNFSVTGMEMGNVIFVTEEQWTTVYKKNYGL